MPTYRVTFNATVSDEVEINIDNEDNIDEDTILSKWDCLPLFDGYTTGWDGITIDFIEELD
jgi:hypothetical protein